MELTALKMLGGLLSGMTITEGLSLLFIIGVAMVIAGKSVLKFTDYMQKSKTAAVAAAVPGQPTVKNVTDEQVLIQISLLRDKLNAIDSRINDNTFEMPKELANELGHLFKKIESGHEESQNAHRDILKMMSVIEDGISIIKEKIAQIDHQLPTLKTDSKDVIKEINQNVQAVAKDIATLQGTILGNMSSRSNR